MKEEKSKIISDSVELMSKMTVEQLEKARAFLTGIAVAASHVKTETDDGKKKEEA